MTLYYFEDTLLASLEAVDLSRLLEVIEQLAPDTEPLFSDKIRILPSWEYIFRALHDPGHRNVVTGTNTSLLGREQGAKHHGPHPSYEIFPLTTGNIFTAHMVNQCDKSFFLT